MPLLENLSLILNYLRQLQEMRSSSFDRVHDNFFVFLSNLNPLISLANCPTNENATPS